MQFHQCNSNYANFLLRLFANLSIGEAAGTPPPDPFFLQVGIALLMPRRSDELGTDNWRRMWELNNKSH